MTSIVCIFGSPRPDGNSTFLAQTFCTAAEKQGAEIKKFQLSELNYSGCRNLFICKTSSDRCGQNDDLTEVLNSIYDADIVLLSSPIYFTDVSGQLKLCLDRWFSFFVPGYAKLENKSRLGEGKTIVFVQTQGEGEENYTDILSKYNHSFELLGFERTYLIRAAGVRELGDIQSQPDVIEQSAKLGAELARMEPRSDLKTKQ